MPSVNSDMHKLGKIVSMTTPNILENLQLPFTTQCSRMTRCNDMECDYVVDFVFYYSRPTINDKDISDTYVIRAKQFEYNDQNPGTVARGFHSGTYVHFFASCCSTLAFGTLSKNVVYSDPNLTYLPEDTKVWGFVWISEPLPGQPYFHSPKWNGNRGTLYKVSDVKQAKKEVGVAITPFSQITTENRVTEFICNIDMIVSDVTNIYANNFT